MFAFIANAAHTVVNALTSGVSTSLKAIKYFIDATFRDTVVPEPGSVLYCDLWVLVEHSGIYVGGGEISNIVVDGFAESTVCRSRPESFTSASKLGRKIYVSCDSHGAVGHGTVARGANAHVGEQAFYGLVIKNCHQFSSKCVDYAGRDIADSSLFDDLWARMPSETWEPTLAMLKEGARKKLGATKWRLWDWDGALAEGKSEPEPDWQAQQDFFKNQALNAQSIDTIRAELAATQAYEAEIADENIPAPIRQHLAAFGQTLADVAHKYDEVKDFLALCPAAGFSYADLMACNDDFAALAKLLGNNAPIKALAHKMGRNYISAEKKKQTKIPQASKSEVYGTHRSDDVMRMLPSELLNLEDETLEVLFYARLLEKNLLTYELQGVSLRNGETTEACKKRTGPVVACLDTSGSMQGAPLLKAKALLLAIANILQQEDRSLHVLLFGEAGQIREFSLDGAHNSAGLLKFLQQGFGGGTDFETPLKHALALIAAQPSYKKADILLISDGDCSLSAEFSNHVKTQKEILNSMVYTVLCAGSKTADGFSDEVLVL